MPAWQWTSRLASFGVSRAKDRIASTSLSDGGVSPSRGSGRSWKVRRSRSAGREGSELGRRTLGHGAPDRVDAANIAEPTVDRPASEVKSPATRATGRSIWMAKSAFPSPSTSPCTSVDVPDCWKCNSPAVLLNLSAPIKLNAWLPAIRRWRHPGDVDPVALHRMKSVIVSSPSAEGVESASVRNTKLSAPPPPVRTSLPRPSISASLPASPRSVSLPRRLPAVVAGAAVENVGEVVSDQAVVVVAAGQVLDRNVGVARRVARVACQVREAAATAAAAVT